MKSKQVVYRGLPICLLLLLSACSIAPEPVCSRAESIENQKRCPAPAPPLTKKAQQPSDETEEAANSEQKRPEELQPHQQARREELLAQIEKLQPAAAKAYSEAKVDAAANEALVVTQVQYTVQLGAFKYKKGQQALSEQVNHPDKYNYELNNGLHAISVGQFSTTGDAEQLVNMMKDKGFKGAYITPLPPGAVNIREY